MLSDDQTFSDASSVSVFPLSFLFNFERRLYNKILFKSLPSNKIYSQCGKIIKSIWASGATITQYRRQPPFQVCLWQDYNLF